MFRGDPNEPTQIQGYTNRYVSAPFAWLLAQSHSVTDTLRVVLLKTLTLKSLLSAALLTFLLVSAAYNRKIRPLIVRLSLVMFSIPYMIFGLAGFYHAPISSLAVLICLVTINLWLQNKVKWRIHLSCLALISSLILLISQTRFEAFAALSVMVILLPVTRFWRQNELNIAWNKYLMLVGVLAGVASLSIAYNTKIKIWVVATLGGNAQILSRETADTSLAVRLTGDAGFSLTAPLTLIDNTTRNVGAQFADATRIELSSQWGSLLATVLDVVLRTLSWVPIIIIFGGVLRRFYDSLSSNSSLREKVVVATPFTIWALLFLLIPAYARTPWFIWYVMPILLCTVVSVDDGTHITKYERWAIIVAVAVNLTSTVATSQILGDLVIAGLRISPLGQSLVSSALLFVCAYLVLIIFRRVDRSHNANCLRS